MSTTTEPRLSMQRRISDGRSFPATRETWTANSQPTFRSESSLRHARPLSGPAAGRIAWFLH